MRRSSNNARIIHGHTLCGEWLEGEVDIVDPAEELQQQIRLYLGNEQPRCNLAEWLAVHAQELSDLPHDGRWELHADVWMLVWQVEEGSIEEGAFASALRDLLPRSPAIVRSLPSEVGEHMQTTSSADTPAMEPLMLAGGPAA
jgi:hypothetical protein